MMTLLPRSFPTSHTSASVGILGGFFRGHCFSLNMAEEIVGKTTDLHENKFRWLGYFEYEDGKDGDNLVNNFYGCK